MRVIANLDDSRGQLGLSGIFGEEGHFSQLQICSFNVVIKQLACGLYHTIFGADNGLLYSMGCNKYGQLGIGDREAENQSSPTLIAALMPDQSRACVVAQIACGLNHSLALTESGDVYAWGRSLAITRDEDEYEPVCITEKLEEPIVQVSAGGAHSGFVTMAGALMFCGENTSGQLGVNPDTRG